MGNFREVYCEKNRCTPAQFERRVFWSTLYPHARLVAPVILLVNRDFFRPDRTLITCSGDAVTMKRIRDEVRDYFWDSQNHSWVREVLRLRVSGQRVKELARKYIPEGSSVPPFPPPEPKRPAA